MIRLISAIAGDWKIILTFAFGLVIGLAIGIVVAVRSPPETYDECMLKQMRGQPRTMMGSAHTVCSERHPG